MRAWLLAFLGFSFATAAAFSCSSSSSDGGGGSDASSEGAVADDGGGGDDGASDAGSDTGSNSEGGPTCASALKGTCDLVAQNCPQGKECSFVTDNVSGAITTACVTGGTGNKPIGAKCCPDQANQCVAGLQCVGGSSCANDAGPTGRCSPFCCPGNDQTCATSIPEGFRGTCDTNLVTQAKDGGTVSLGNVCTYKGVCTPFKIQACPQDFACLLQQDGVSFRCSSIFSPPGKAAGEACNAANDCADGMECLGPADGGSTCRIICYHPDGGAPFDGGGLESAEAGLGGCPAGKGCGGSVTGAPAWFGFCTP